MKKRKGFTFTELLAVIAILGILVSIAVPSITPAIEYSEKNTTNTVHKVLVNAIDAWVKANYDAAQRPDNFYSKNSQGHAVYEYIASNEVYQCTNMSVTRGKLNMGSKEKDKVFVFFEKGVLKTEYVKNVSTIPKVKNIFGVHEMQGEQIKDYDNKVAMGYIIGTKDASGNVSKYREVSR